MIFLNRERRRALEKAVRCMKRGTNIPAGVVGKVPHQALDLFAAKLDKRLRRDGSKLFAESTGLTA